MTQDYNIRSLIRINKERAKKGIGNNKVTHNPDETNPEYEAFLRKYEKLCGE